MRHRNRGRKLSRTAQERRALWATMSIALIEHERITTTDAKAKELRRWVEKLVTMGKKGGLANWRNAYAFVRHEDTVARLFGPLKQRFADRHGGYTRIVKVGRRAGDNAPLSMIEFVDREEKSAE
jgi:large subunit ribosomal protein L17